MGLPLDRIEAPPRSVSALLTAQMMLGGAMSQIGWLVFGFGSIFFWVFAWHADLSGWRFRDGVTANVEGQSLGCRDTGYSVGGRRTPGQRRRRRPAGAFRGA
jgi:hypothetical protein